MNDYTLYRFKLSSMSQSGDMDGSVSFTVTDGADVLASLLAPLGFESFSTDPDDDSILLAYIPKKMADNESAATAASSLADITGTISASVDSIEEIEGQDWNEEWEKHYFQPIVVAGRCVIHSSFHKDYPICPIDITIDPKMAFGTGHHATTSLMARFLLDNEISGKSVIDMGTGTGLLAIISAMRGASPVTAIEIDPAAKDNAVENVALNGHSEINVILGDASSLAAVEPADIFLANINRNVILADLRVYASRLKPDGMMALSGFYEQDIEMLLEAAAALGLHEHSRNVAETGLVVARTQTLTFQIPHHDKTPDTSAIAFIIATAAALAEMPEKCRINFNDTVRTYRMYIPENLEKGAPLCLYIHGYNSKGRWVADLNAAADRHGYAVCYPDGLPDSQGKEGWNVGYPSQYNMGDDVPFIKALVAEVCEKNNLDPENVFVTGSSNGGDIIYQMLYTEPDIFKAYASVAGLTFCNVFLNNRLTIPVPLMEIHGTGDKVSMWNGDPENRGGWGPYVSVPVAVGAVAANNRCQSYRLEDVTAKPEATHRVRRHIYTDSPSGCDVELYELEDAPHSWHSKDIDTGEIILSFFDRYRTAKK